MKIKGKLLGLDSSAVAASCAIVENGKVLSRAADHTKTTHSQVLMPLVESVLDSAGLTLNDIDGFAVSHGPGSFTGLRIGVSAVKGMAYASHKPVCGVSTLLALAYSCIGRDCIAAPVMDARRGEVYNALFDIKGDEITRLTEDRAISLDQLKSELEQYSGREVVVFGDCIDLPDCKSERLCLAECVCMVADEFVSAKELMPIYIRKPQAQREREERLCKPNKKSLK